MYFNFAFYLFCTQGKVFAIVVSLSRLSLGFCSIHSPHSYLVSCGVVVAFCIADSGCSEEINFGVPVRYLSLEELVTGLVIIYVWIAPICPE